tara:strand:+ start:2578 stop:3360 length:783 start_codon:yes stop_codon:yes gene_type:complete
MIKADNKSENLINFAFNNFSQNGEDGVIQEILRRLGLQNSEKNWCVEFGAWDGIHLSNTFNLVEQGWNAVYLEGDKSRYKDLIKTAKKYPKIFPINAFVSKESNSRKRLDELLKKTEIPLDFDLLSIDIDSYDLEVWESLKEYNPKIIIIEINSEYPPGIIKWHSNKHQNTKGNSFSATLNVAKDKGYELCCHTGNMIFIKSELISMLNIDEKYLKFPELLYNDLWFSLDKQNGFLKFIRRLNTFFQVKILRNKDFYTRP